MKKYNVNYKAQFDIDENAIVFATNWSKNEALQKC